MSGLKSRSGANKSFFLGIVLSTAFTVILFTPSAGIGASSCDTTKTVNHYTLVFTGVTYDSTAGTSKWDYELTWDGIPPSLSHFSIELCTLITNANLVAASPSGASIGQDGSTGLYSIKWDGIGNFPANTPVTFSFTLNLLLAVDHTQFAPKAGINTNLATICGPSVNCQSPPCTLSVQCRDTTLNADPGQCGAAVTFSAGATGTCGPISVACTPPSGSVFPVGATTVTCIATDAVGNKDTCQFTVTVNDAENPTIACPANIITGNDPGQCGATVSYTAPATDNCPGVTVVCSPPAGSFFPVGTTTVSCTATDASSGNQASCSFTVTVNDTENPTISCPPNIVKGNDPNNCDTLVTFIAIPGDNCPGVSYVCSPPSGSLFPVGTTVVTCTATDAAGNQASCQFTVTVNDVQGPTIVCSPNITTGTDLGRCDAVVTYTVTASNGCPGVTLVCNPASGSIFPKGTTTVNCTATDVAGNTASCSFTVTVNDDENPTISCPANIVQGNDPGQCGAVVTYTANAADNCPGVSYVCSPLPSGSFFSVGTTLVTCTATDAAGNTASCSFTVTVNDNENPTVVCPANITTNTDPGRCDANVIYSATGFDNCRELTFGCTPPPGSVFPKGVTTVNCTATDASGNTASCSFTVTVNDNENPTVNCPANITTNTAPGRCDATVNYTATPGDNCPGVNMVCTPPAGSVFPVGTTTVICIATDASGNRDTCQFTVTVNDTEPPIASCPADITVNATGGGNCTAVVNYTANVSDNCAGAAISCTPPSGSTFPAGTTIVTCIATDAAGNKDTCQFNVNVVDNIPPTVTCPVNITTNTAPGQCAANVSYTANASDNCPGASIVCTPPSGSSFPVGATTVTCIATDGAGNKDTCQFTVTVNDNEPPAAQCPANITVNNNPSAPCDSVPVSYTASGNDNCPGPVTVVCNPPSGSSFPLGVTAVTCIATDGSGNQSTCGFTIAVLQSTPCVIPPDTACLPLEIDDVSAFLGSEVEVSISNPGPVAKTAAPLSGGSDVVGGFSFLISYDCACLQFLSARQGTLLVEQEWEFFTYRYGSIGNGNCGSGCPSCLIRIVAIADVNNGASHPNLSGGSAGEWVVLKFRVSNDRTLNGMCCPISWYWFDCTDNAVSDSTGNELWVARQLFSADGNPIDLATEFPTDVSNCDQFSGGPGKPSPIKKLCFKNGRICIPFDTDIDDRGDLNLNGFAHDVGDAVLYENYFIYGSGVLSADPTQRQAQIAASDVNGDGISLSVGDLVALIRVLTGDAAPLSNKVVPTAAGVNLSWTLSGGELKVTTASASELGGLFVHFKYRGTAEKTLTLLTPADGMAPKVNAENGELRILINSDQRGAKLPAGEVSFSLPADGELEFVEAQASNYQGQPLPVTAKAAALPTQFALSQNYPNPFNPKTNFTLSLPSAGHYKISIYNLLGEAVRTFEGEAAAGHQNFIWDGTDSRGKNVSSGLYFYKAEVGKFTVTKKMMLLR
ncbi:MAG: HYR domain-containing protein [candidate division Zixibacteria bacterium]|nr:HYR domain-containing protein [candidate division Zixibacteria bacterium]